MNEFIIILFTLTVPIYWMWRTHIATQARIDLLEGIDTFLNPKKGNSEMSMDIVYNAYEDSKRHFFIIEMLFYTFFKIKSENFKQNKAIFKKMPEEERKKMIELVIKILFTNLKLSPLTYFFAGLVFLVIALSVALLNHLSPSRIKGYAQSLQERTLYSIYTF